MSTLTITQLSGSYGHGNIVNDISFQINTGTVVTIMGLNGMGKSTLLKAIMCLLPKQEGKIALDGQSIPMTTMDIVRHGIAYVPEDRQMFDGLTVRENLMVSYRAAASMKYDTHITSANRDRLAIEDIYLFFPRLKERENANAETLSGGEKQMVAIARAMLLNPLFMLLDEPSEGLAPHYVDEIRKIILQLTVKGVGILLIEQNIGLSMEVSNKAYVMKQGRFAHEIENMQYYNNREELSSIMW